MSAATRSMLLSLAIALASLWAGVSTVPAAALLLVATTLVIVHVRGRASAAAQHVLWLATGVALIVLVVVHATVRTGQWKVTLAPPTGGGSVVPADWMLRLWLVGALAVGLQVVVGWWRAARLARSGRALPDGAVRAELDRLSAAAGLAQPVAARLIDHLTVPSVAGIIRPTLLLPAAVEDWDPQQRQLVLLHEVAHVARRDLCTALLMQLAVALHWYLPIVWQAAQREVLAREAACDDAVLRRGADAPSYAEVLVAFARRAAASPPHPALALLVQPSALHRRVAAVLASGRRRDPLPPQWGLILVVAALLASALGLGHHAAMTPLAPLGAPLAPLAPLGMPLAPLGSLTDSAATPLATAPTS